MAVLPSLFRQRLLPHLLPTPCALCGCESTWPLCSACTKAYLTDHQQRCRQCARTLKNVPATHCGSCLTESPAFDLTFTLGDYLDPAKRLVLDLKFHAALPLAGVLAHHLAQRVQYVRAKDSSFDMPELLLPVPLSAQRLCERGFNQSWEISRRMASVLNLSSDAQRLHKIRDVAPQSTLTMKARHANMHGAFALTGPVSGLHVGVVDDVMTSGATLAEIAQLLKRHGARRVTNLVALRTP